MKKSSMMSLSVTALLGLSFVGEAVSAEVNLYSARKENLIKPLLDRFTEQSGIAVNLVTGKADALLQRLEREGDNSPADLLLTTDAGRLHRAKQAGVLQPVQSATLEAATPNHYTDPEGYWHGLSVRARVIVYATDRVDPSALSNYMGLAGDQWEGRICIRSSDNIYNQSLVASRIAHYGQQAVDQWLEGLVENLARRPAGGDRDQVKAVAVGQCDLAVVNTYYLGVMLSGDDEAQREMAEQVSVFWPNQGSTGVHVNVSGIGLTQAANNREEAVQLMEFLVSDEAQRWYAEQNHEYPVKAGIEASELLQSWGEFKADDLSLGRLGELNAEAVKAMDRAGWR